MPDVDGDTDAAPVALSGQDGEEDLIRRAQQKDAGAFELLYRIHVGRTYALCLRMTANVTRAEDMTQKAFITAWQKLPLFRSESAFGSWLHRLTVNTVLADIRSHQRRSRWEFPTDDLQNVETPRTASPAPTGTRLDLDRAISELPPQARAVFVLHDVEGYRHEEIATMMGVAVGTTKAQLHRARKLLQEALQ